MPYTTPEASKEPNPSIDMQRCDIRSRVMDVDDVSNTRSTRENLGLFIWPYGNHGREYKIDGAVMTAVMTVTATISQQKLKAHVGAPWGCGVNRFTKCLDVTVCR